MAQTKSKYYGKSYAGAAIGCFPEDTAFTGTMTSVAGTDVVSCAGTDSGFANIKQGDYLVLKTTTASEVIAIAEVDYANKKIHLEKNCVNTHTGVNINVIQDKNAPYVGEYVTIFLKSGGAALYFNGNVISPTDKQMTKITFEYCEPMVVESDVAYAITNAKF